MPSRAALFSLVVFVFGSRSMTENRDLLADRPCPGCPQLYLSLASAVHQGRDDPEAANLCDQNEKAMVDERAGVRSARFQRSDHLKFWIWRFAGCNSQAIIHL
ncbi:uncharacterized protein B0T23DRAFT_70303 [Neurospora hispaniola]|uniref:Secreted protein n=1 Tax=Neurospora hispaniola TaxID=588809 RepID=A0AAJ0IC19_9PEZI|nr:hypothetical protein B0T23DRAFT_70303 [Neurospora hispaniola]